MVHSIHPNCGFQRGHKPWCKGLTKKTDVRLAEAGKKISRTQRGRKLTKEHKQKLSESHQGPRPWRKGKKFPYIPHYAKRGQPAWNKGLKLPEWSGENHHMYGKHHTLETKKRISLSRKGKLVGKDNPAWRGGKVRRIRTGYSGKQYKKWRFTIFVRDKFTCQKCGKTHIYLTAHHIKSFTDYPKLRFDLNNGRTLCEDCHKLTDNYGVKAWRSK